MVTAYVRPAPTGKVGQRDDTDGVIITKSNNEDDARPIFGQISFGSTKAVHSSSWMYLQVRNNDGAELHAIPADTS